MVSHYAPTLPVRLMPWTLPPTRPCWFGPPLPGGTCQFQLSPTGSLSEAAARLFEGLRWLDAEGANRGARAIAVMPIPDGGLGAAINDRLRGQPPHAPSSDRRHPEQQLWSTTRLPGG